MDFISSVEYSVLIIYVYNFFKNYLFTYKNISFMLEKDLKNVTRDN